MREESIYGLLDPRTKIIRYVGFSSKPLIHRLREHICEARKRNSCHRHRWIRSLLTENFSPEIVLLERVNAANWQERERHWIKVLTRNRLINSTVGGEGLIHPSTEVRDRISKKVSASLVGNSRRLGTTHSEESKRRISEGSLKAWASGKIKRGPRSFTDESRLRLKVNLGKRFSAEHRAKISVAAKARWANIMRGGKTE